MQSRDIEKEDSESQFENEGDCEIESARTSSLSERRQAGKDRTGTVNLKTNSIDGDGDTKHTTSVMTEIPNHQSPRRKDGSHIETLRMVTEIPRERCLKSKLGNNIKTPRITTIDPTHWSPMTKAGKKKSKRNAIPAVATKTSKKKQDFREDMERLLYEIALRTQHKARTLEFEAKRLGDTADKLRNENKALKRLQRSQKREIHERHDFVDMANMSLRGFRRDVRYTEEDYIGAEVATRKKNRKVIRLQNECAKYDDLIKIGSNLPSLEELEENIEKALTQLQKRDENIEELQMKLAAANKKAKDEYQKERKRFLKLQNEIEETSKECRELTSRIKAAEKKIDKTNIYSRKLGPAQSLPAITWYPPNEEQTPTNKVERWLNKHK